jgi:hypothetical protein
MRYWITFSLIRRYSVTFRRMGRVLALHGSVLFRIYGKQFLTWSERTAPIINPTIDFYARKYDIVPVISHKNSATPPYLSIISVLILSSHLPLCHQNVFFFSNFQTKILDVFNFSLVRATCSADLIFLDLITLSKASQGLLAPIQRYCVSKVANRRI